MTSFPDHRANAAWLTCAGSGLAWRKWVVAVEVSLAYGIPGCILCSQMARMVEALRGGADGPLRGAELEEGPHLLRAVAPEQDRLALTWVLS